MAPGTRAVSLVPSITETLRAWGVDPVACTRFCEQPDLPTVGGTKNPDVDAIVELRPDVVLVDKVENRREDATALTERGVRVVAVDVRTLADVGPELETLAAAVGVVPSAHPAADWRNPGPVDPELTAFVPIWRRPWMTIGPATYGSTLLASIGVANVYRSADDDFPQVTLEEAGARRPDVVLAPSEPYAFLPDHLTELSSIAPVVEVDGRDLFWWGVRTPRARIRLQEQLLGAP